ncbi:hypothetical protein VTK73DRAFT_3942 [Phialemonium thermophilum]|uniref:Uncharacterized protein n=1 Tax=Phialemonium thermophilum TaxID=223376 RepID=A0ABR3XZN0_9PEZI
MEPIRRYLFTWAVLIGLLFLRARADCASYGVDYANGGSYSIDASSNQYFSFITVFQGCSEESINPILVGPDGSEYACSSIDTQPAGAQMTSTCGIPFSAMQSGTWRVIIQSDQIAVQRTFTLTVGLPQTVVVTVTPTVVLGITSTPRAQTTRTTITQTQTLILVPTTVSAGCNGGTRTVTQFSTGGTVTVTVTSTRTETNGQRTSYTGTTISATATCHYPSSSTNYDSSPTQLNSCSGNENCRPIWLKGSGHWSWMADEVHHTTTEVQKRDADAVAAVTSTYTETTYTYTRTVITTAPARTVTDTSYAIVTATVTPAPSTICTNGGSQYTVTVVRGTGGAITQTNVIITTTRASGTVWIGLVFITLLSILTPHMQPRQYTLQSLNMAFKMTILRADETPSC